MRQNYGSPGPRFRCLAVGKHDSPAIKRFTCRPRALGSPQSQDFAADCLLGHPNWRAGTAVPPKVAGHPECALPPSRINGETWQAVRRRLPSRSVPRSTPQCSCSSPSPENTATHGPPPGCSEEPSLPPRSALSVGAWRFPEIFSAPCSPQYRDSSPAIAELAGRVQPMLVA